MHLNMRLGSRTSGKERKDLPSSHPVCCTCHATPLPLRERGRESSANTPQTPYIMKTKEGARKREAPSFRDMGGESSAYTEIPRS